MVATLPSALWHGDLDLAVLPDLTDDEVRQELMQVKGIGAWTANIYLMEVLLRPDIWPVGDLALAVAAQQVKGLAARPTPDELTCPGGTLAALAGCRRPYPVAQLSIESKNGCSAFTLKIAKPFKVLSELHCLSGHSFDFQVDAL